MGLGRCTRYATLRRGYGGAAWVPRLARDRACTAAWAAQALGPGATDASYRPSECDDTVALGLTRNGDAHLCRFGYRPRGPRTYEYVFDDEVHAPIKLPRKGHAGEALLLARALPPPLYNHILLGQRRCRGRVLKTIPSAVPPKAGLGFGGEHAGCEDSAPAGGLGAPLAPHDGKGAEAVPCAHADEVAA